MAKFHRLTPEVKTLLEQAAAPLPPYPRLNKSKDGFCRLKYHYKGHQLQATGLKEIGGKPILPTATYSIMGLDMQKPYRILEQAFERKGKAGIAPAIKAYLADHLLAMELLKNQSPHPQEAIAED